MMAGESSKNTEQAPTAAPPPALYLHPSAFSYPTAQSGVPPPAWPPGVYPPAVLPYPPPVASGGEGTDPAAPIGYVMIPPPPPGMVYAFPPAYTYPPPPIISGGDVATSASTGPTKPKRKQVKQACSNCAAACKRCDDNRPCARCEKYNIEETCVDAKRKERQKGVKRGPYKRRARENEASAVEPTSPTDWLSSPSTVPEGYPPQYFIPPGYLPMPPTSEPTSSPGAPATDGTGPPPPPSYPMPSLPYPAFPPYMPPLMPLAQPSRVETPKDENEKKRKEKKKEEDGTEG